MDYFSELLESYNKLKKRTFKLTYITEAEDKPANGGSSQEDIDSAATKEAEDQAHKVALAGVKQKYDPDKEKKGGKPWAFLSPEKGGKLERVSLTLGAGRAMALADSAGKAIVDSNGWKALVSYFKKKGPGAHDSDVADEEARRLAIEDRERNLAAHGGALDILADIKGDDAQGVIEAGMQCEASIIKFCEDFPEAQEKSKEIELLCASPRTYVTGARNTTFEAKLAKGLVLQVEEEHWSRRLVLDKFGLAKLGEKSQDRKVDQTVSLNPELMQEVAESHASLINFLSCNPEAEEGEPDYCRCEGMKSQIGKYNNKLVLFGQGEDRGVVIKPGVLQNLSFKMMKEKCKTTDSDYVRVFSDIVNNNSINGVKGTLNETLFQIGIVLHRAANDDAGKQEVIDFIKKSKLPKKLKDRMDALIVFAKTKEAEDDVALDFEDAWKQEVLLEQANLMINEETGAVELDKNLRDFILQEMKYQQEFVRLVDADSARAAGEEGGTGDRGDTELLYKNDKGGRKRLKEACENLGVDVPDKKIDPDTQMLVLAIGQKRSVAIKKLKLGESNSIERQGKYMTGSLEAESPGFDKKIGEMQFGSDPEPRLKRAQDLYEKIEAKIKKDTAKFLKTVTYSSGRGGIKIQSAGTTIDLAFSDYTISNFEEGDLGLSLREALFNKDGTKRDMKSEVNRKRLHEVVQREARSLAYKKALESEDAEESQAARDALMRCALISGANTQPMPQVMTNDEGLTVSIDHNAALQEICDAENASLVRRGERALSTKARQAPARLRQAARRGTTPPDITVQGFTTTFTSPAGITVKYGQTRSKDSGDTRSETYLDESSIMKLNNLKSPENNSTLENYLKGQMKLLETLISQSK